MIYVSVEMPEHEIVARWITREAFFLTLERRTPWISYSAVLYGSAWRNEVTQDPMRNHAIHKTLVDAMHKVGSVVGPSSLPHVFIQRAPSGTTPWDIRRLVRAAREAHAPARRRCSWSTRSSASSPAAWASSRARRSTR
ncbi:MAG: hypothetical protein IPG81_29145 [Sandaracinaceae bacterium]|nr:hypothetical protein [Sandaracinaceae bacterium]